MATIRAEVCGMRTRPTICARVLEKRGNCEERSATNHDIRMEYSWSQNVSTDSYIQAELGARHRDQWLELLDFFSRVHSPLAPDASM